MISAAIKVYLASGNKNENGLLPKKDSTLSASNAVFNFWSIRAMTKDQESWSSSFIDINNQYYYHTTTTTHICGSYLQVAFLFVNDSDNKFGVRKWVLILS